jgi:hypothetical protein
VNLATYHLHRTPDIGREYRITVYCQDGRKRSYRGQFADAFLAVQAGEALHGAGCRAVATPLVADWSDGK